MNYKRQYPPKKYRKIDDRSQNYSDKNHTPTQRQYMKHQTKNSIETHFSYYPSNSFPHFRLPKEIGSFSTDENKEFLHDRSRLRYYREPLNPCVSYDLRNGYDKFISKDEDNKEYLDHLLKWVLLNLNLFKPTEITNKNPNDFKKRIDICTDFICWRGLLTKIIASPYTFQQSWKCAIYKYRGTFYMCEFDTDSRIEELKNRTAKLKEMSFWGWKFEDYLLSDSPNTAPNPEKIVNNNISFASVVRTRLDSHSLVYAGEVDGCEIHSDESRSYVELKTNVNLYSTSSYENFKRNKQIKNWIQSFLLNIPKIVIGYRDNNGVVNKIESCKTEEIPTKIGESFWDGCCCFTFLNYFLSWVKKIVVYGDNDIISDPYVFEFFPREKRVFYSKRSANSEFRFFPDWYLKEIEKHFGNSYSTIMENSRSYVDPLSKNYDRKYKIDVQVEMLRKEINDLQEEKNKYKEVDIKEIKLPEKNISIINNLTNPDQKIIESLISNSEEMKKINKNNKNDVGEYIETENMEVDTSNNSLLESNVDYVNVSECLNGIIESIFETEINTDIVIDVRENNEVESNKTDYIVEDNKNKENLIIHNDDDDVVISVKDG